MKLKNKLQSFGKFEIKFVARALKLNPINNRLYFEDSHQQRCNNTINHSLISNLSRSSTKISLEIFNNRSELQ